MWINIDLVLLLKRRKTRFFNSPKTCKTRRWSLLLDKTFIFFIEKRWKLQDMRGQRLAQRVFMVPSFPNRCSAGKNSDIAYLAPSVVWMVLTPHLTED